MAQQDDGDRPRPEVAHALDTTPKAVTNGYSVAIRRTGHCVEITLTSNSEYGSIELYDSLIQSVKKGSLRLDLNFSRP